MRLTALILAWIGWAALAINTLFGPLLFLLGVSGSSGNEMANSAMIWSAWFSGVLGIVFLLLSRLLFHGRPVGKLDTWLAALGFVMFRLLGSSLLAGAITLICLSVTPETNHYGWIAVCIGVALLIYTAQTPKSSATALQAAQ